MPSAQALLPPDSLTQERWASRNRRALLRSSAAVVWAAALIIIGSALTLRAPNNHTTLAKPATQLAAHLSCEDQTGGTCLISACDPQRNASCSSVKGCVCVNGSCADSRGICRLGRQFRSAAGPAWAREELQWVCASAWVSIAGRMAIPSLALGSCQNALCWALGSGGPPTPKVNYDVRSARSWKKAKELYGYDDNLYAVFAATIKLICVHLLQPLSFFVAFYAYGPLLSLWQYCLGIVVVLREAFYVGIAFYALPLTPGYLLFQPLREQDKVRAAMYVCCPIFFIADSLELSDGQKIDLVAGMIAADMCALGALAAGMIGWGTMWPALGVGYLVAFLNPLCIAFLLVSEYWNR